jgi:hypothetical protein
MANTTVAFNLPSPYQTDLDKIAQQQKMAELLQAQSFQPTERYSYKGIEAQTPVTAGLAKMLQGFTAMQMQEKGLEEQKALGERYRGDQSTDFTNIAKMLSAPAVAGQAEIPARAAEIAPEEMAQSADYGTPLPGAAIPAVPARRAGQIDPEMMGQAKTPEGQQMLMAQLLSQIGPKAPIKLGAGESLVNPITFKSEFTAPKEQKFGTTPSIEKSDTSPTGYIGVVYSDTGERKVTGPINPVNQFTTGTVDAGAKLKQDREISDRAFNGLSANQRAQLQNDAARLGISAQQLYYDTGLKGGGGAALPPPGAVPQQVPQVAPQGAAPQQAMPTQDAAAPRPMVPAAAPQPGAMVAQTPINPAMAALTPKARNEIAAKLTEQGIVGSKDAQSVLNLMDGVEGLIDKAHGSGLGNIVGGTQNFFGISSDKNAADAQLNALSGALVSKQPKMSGPQSDKDVLLYKQMAGDLGNPTLPASVRKAAAKTVREIQRTYLNGYSATGYQPKEGATEQRVTGKIKRYNPTTGMVE